MKRFVQLVCVALLAGGLAACLPSFPEQAALVVAPDGSGGLISWPAATDADEGQTIASYRVDVDGVEVSRVDGSATSCQLTGLSEGSHPVVVTAYDSHGDWSGTASSGARVSGDITPPAPVSSGGEPACVVPTTSSEAEIVIDGVSISGAVDPALGVSVEDRVVPGVGSPDGVDLRVDAVGLEVTGVAAGEVAEVSLTLSEPMDAVRLLSGTTWEPFEFDGDTGAQVAGEGYSVTIDARDGGRGDEDGAADGSITIGLALGTVRSAAVSPSAPEGVPEVPLPQTAPGWSEARPALTLAASGSSVGKLVVLRINETGQLQYELQATVGVFTPFSSLDRWSDWTTVPGTGELVGSPAAYGSSVYARGADGTLKRIQIPNGVYPITSSVVVTTMSPLPDGVEVAGSPSVGTTSGFTIVVLGSDGGMWASNQLGSGGSWALVPGSGPTATASAAVAPRADGTGAELWMHDDQHGRRQISYTAATGWDGSSVVSDAGPWAGSPSATKPAPPSGGTSNTVVADIDRQGRIVTEVLRGTPARFVNGTGFVGSTAMVNWSTTVALAAVRTDGAVTLRHVLASGDLNPAGGATAVVGAPGPASFKTPANGSTVAPGSPVTMTVNAGYQATDYHWKLNDVPDEGDPIEVASAWLPAASGLSWTVPASTLQDGHRYQWRAEAYRSDNGLTAPTDLLPPWYGFTVTSGQAPVQTAPQDGATTPIDAAGAVTLTASPVPGATGYRFSLWGDSGPPFVKSTTTSSWTMTGWFGALIAPGTTLSWSVQAVFGTTVGAPSPKRSFTAVVSNGAPPATPALQSPSDGTRVNPDAAFDLRIDYPADNHKKEYRFELWEDTATGRSWVAGHNSPYEVWNVPAGTLQPNRTYDWTVRVYDYATAQLSGWPTPWHLSSSTDRLSVGSVLTGGNHLESPNGYRLEMQTDGNVVVYKPDGDVLAATNRLIPSGGSNPYLVMQADGNLVEYQDQPQADRKVIWASGTSGPNPFLIMQGDGNAVVYVQSGSTRPVWASNSLIPKPPPPPPNTGGSSTFTVGGTPFSGARVTAAANAEARFTLSTRAMHPADTVSYAVTLPGTGLPQLNSAQIASARSSLTLTLKRVTSSGATTVGTLSGTFSQEEKPQHRLGNLVLRGTRGGLSVGDYRIEASYQHPTLMATRVTSSAPFRVLSASTPIPGTVSPANLAPSFTMLRGVCGVIGGYAALIGLSGQVCVMAEMKPTGNTAIDLAAAILPPLAFTGNFAVYGTAISSAGSGYELSGLGAISNGTFYDFDSMDSCISGGFGLVSGGFCWKDSGHFPSVQMKAALFAGVGFGGGVSVALNDQLWYGVFTDRWYCQGHCGPEA